MSTSSPLELKQRYLNERREFYLEAEHIRLFGKDLNGERQAFIKYEDLTTNTWVLKKQDGIVFIAAIAFTVIALLSIAVNLLGFPSLSPLMPLWVLAAVFFWGLHLYKKRKYLVVDLKDKRFIYFFWNNPSKEELAVFLESMQEARRRYMRKTYFPEDAPFNPDVDLEKLKWLLNQEIITKAEYNERVEAINKYLSRRYSQYMN